ncbi:AbrB family transcriptional regulator [Nocardia terpenica]|uniref:AbrB family transcriptional regulator n=1 Tax=Nocardia terpenica TaxID=455432 RepID=UPI00142E2D07|nr:AbrB family transcriptional regulator [Nocardia terpenica]
MALTLAVGVMLTGLGLAGGWLIAAMLAAGLTALGTGHVLVPNGRLVRLAQPVIGVLAALPLCELRGGTSVSYGGAALVAIVCTLTLSIGCGLLLARAAQGITPITGILSMIAGGASTVSTISDQLGGDQRFVSLSQYLRLIIVSATVPVVLPLLGSTAHHAGAPVDQRMPAVGLVVTVAIVAVAGPCAARMKIPAPHLLGPLLVALVVGMCMPAGLRPAVPDLMKNAAYIIIGLQAGGGFSRSAARRFARLLPHTVTCIAATIAGCFGMAVVLSTWYHIPLTEAYLAASPGGIYSVLAISHDIGAGPVVPTLQVLRMIVMLATAIALPCLLSRNWLWRRCVDIRHRLSPPSHRLDTRRGSVERAEP